MFNRRRPPRLETERMVLRLPAHGDYDAWSGLRAESRAFLSPWEPVWAADHLSKKSFTNRVYWAQRANRNGNALPLFLVRHDGTLLGAITLDNIRRGPAQSATIGYWIGQPHARQGFMREAIGALVAHAFGAMDLSRIEAACLPENVASRGALERAGFKYEGVAQSYLQINGRWRNHVLYANLRHDRRGKTEVR
ncbi:MULTISPECIES: GNAT family N-acetyltransferase [Paracoccus]|jgi:ribosomal-protein-alanine N-acetyltransferase|uniref:GNAT family N-acetyltransferase n=1 Tax=Paracoccus litorisediminis TaxID=2006130 RepID=A0A844HMP4_9RHOB|nr:MULTISPECIES: GNAT family protein [Paracoccus]MBD9526793.1 GNAT family N-acetyltransferase [Paracoccus sp. PAR01]MTH59694.1 GNAT family N-acetyltransferase [Paracoccus litorisediminis]